ncbi:MAG: sigma-70 family RNA polymerase sigma factor [Chloroflexi bacterium]|nr:sigma-70 family RNA polymerase sigma factor [Chloroflexota bacterium]
MLARFEHWYQEDIERLYRFIRARVRDTATAEELTAVVCERALALLPRYDPARGSLRAWVFGIARNVLRHHYRAESRAPQTVALDEWQPEGHARPVEAAIQRQERLRLLFDLIDSLPPLDQELIALRYGSGLSNPEIADVTGLTVNHVAVRLHRAREKLKQAAAEVTLDRH